MRLTLERLLLSFALCWTAQVGAQADASGQELRDRLVESVEGGSMTIATGHAPPFAYKDADGQWSGIAIELWNRIATRNGYDFRYIELGLAETLEAVAAGRIDGAVAALTITSAREERFDFSHAFHTSGLAIAVPYRNANLLSGLSRLIAPEFLGLVAGLLALMVMIGVLIWLAERRTNAQFDREPLPGIGSGLWWSAVTMTTVGYGDKAPKTVWGRVLGMVWMFSGLIVISTFTAAITTALTVNELGTTINGVEDLRFQRVLTLKESTSDRFLAEQGIHHRTVGTLAEALAKLAAGEADALVHDAPLLQYQIAEAFPQQLRVLPFSLTRQDYGIALPDGSEIREPINVALLEIISTRDWPAILDDYLKPEH